jgi:hypothetical protein
MFIQINHMNSVGERLLTVSDLLSYIYEGVQPIAPPTIEPINQIYFHLSVPLILLC